MTDRPILISAPMVRAILAGTKTQTRRVLAEGSIYEDISSEAAEDFELRGWTCFTRGDALCAARIRYAVGDRLWVREAWAPLSALAHNDPGCTALAAGGFYRADGTTVDGEITRWRPSIQMPRWASRITLIVTDARVERLQDISEADAIDEGVLSLPPVHASGPLTERGCPPIGGSPVERYARLWDDINGPGAWAANPWIIAYTFTAEARNIDLAKAA